MCLGEVLLGVLTIGITFHCRAHGGKPTLNPKQKTFNLPSVAAEDSLTNPEP